MNKIWEPCNIYPTSNLGKNVNIGSFSEIGEGVVIGDNVRIGAMSFIPEGVTVEDGAWIGPRFTATNDRFPPSGREKWEPILIKKGARIGASVTILPGVTVGENALIGAGSVVCESVGNGELWRGVPARYVRKLDDKEKL
jgi:acetyltransferase-like isoleucine patch superfamily enzyme